MGAHDLHRSPAALAATTPADRDRYIDLLRAVAIGVVVIGHWLVAAVWLDAGRLRASTVLDLAPATRWLTWILQIMPLFFLVGGIVNVRSWRATQAGGGSYASWIARRGARLLRPTTVLVWAWMVLAPVALAAGVDRDLIVVGARNALVPLWFLAAYLLVIALVPVLLAAHDRIGLCLPLALMGAAAMIDAAVRAGAEPLGLLNYLLVWSVPTALGFCWADGVLDRRAVRWLLPVTAFGLLLAAVVWFGYPVSMVGLADAARGGVNTPSVALALLGCVQTGVALAARDRARMWLQRPRIWAGVVRLNLVAMTVYLWHLTVMVLAAGALTLTGVWWSVSPLSVGWWASRPLWLVALALVLAPLVTTLAGVEHSVPRPRTRGAGPLPTAAMAAAVAGASGAIALLTLGDVLSVQAIVGALVLTAAAAHAGAFRGDLADAR